MAATKKNIVDECLLSVKSYVQGSGSVSATYLVAR